MPLTNDPRRAVRGIAAWFALLLLIQVCSPAWGAEPGSSSGVVTKICPAPTECFKTKEARQDWAKRNNCRFLEDVCEKTPASEDNKGANAADSGFWGNLWNKGVAAVRYGYEFGKGLFAGLKEQVTDIVDLVSNPGEVLSGLGALGKAFYDDPKGTLAALGQLLGQEAVDTITRATQCGAYDLGKVIGSYVSPAVALKFSAKLGKFSGKVADAVKDFKKEVGCASFAEGTLIQTPAGSLPINSLGRNDLVAARDEYRWRDADQRITNTFGRVAPSYRELRTEYESFDITDEHPLWVQGKGWTPVKDVAVGDVLAARIGDALVLHNAAINRPLRVYNFSVANTPNYFVGESGLWAHNASVACALKVPDGSSVKLAKALDPLNNFPSDGSWAAHHIITSAVAKKHPFLEAAYNKMAYDQDAAGNGLMLPTKVGATPPNGGVALPTNLPLHKSGHTGGGTGLGDENYHKYVEAKLDKVWEAYRDDGQSWSAERMKSEIAKMQAQITKDLMDGKVTLCKSGCEPQPWKT